jgi:hypothetical protein
MRLSDFRGMVRRMASEIPAEFLEGIVEIAVSPRTVPHPEREEIWTLGECIPLPGEDGDPRHLQTQVVLYHGSFKSLAAIAENFDWREEAWETLAHEVRHHVEWKARAPELEAYDDAAEANYARQDGEPFDPHFYRAGEQRIDGAFQVDDDVFIERRVRERPDAVTFRWQGREYEVSVPADASLPAFLTVEGAGDPPPGELVLVLARPSSWRDLLRAPKPFQAVVQVQGSGVRDQGSGGPANR